MRKLPAVKQSPTQEGQEEKQRRISTFPYRSTWIMQIQLEVTRKFQFMNQWRAGIQVPT
jgi:hypothetical protein